MTTFQSINITLGPRDHMNEATTPTTPRAPFEHTLLQQSSQPREEAESTTPTRDSFVASNGKRALPISPFSAKFPSNPLSADSNRQVDTNRDDPKRPASSQESRDVDMAGSDDGEDVSDTESNDDETGRPSKKKKKGQRFFCTDYPPCNLSFTRSEHLARHIRKHTGERPFQCHCQRRFSRLDNLRQHAQTVHVNEDIPDNSLAATGTRFQRQVRTDRIRPPGARSRASTSGSQGSHGRGHGRNLSTSSIASTASTMSTMSTMSSISRENSQRRPQSLIMGDEQSPRARLTIDTMRGSPQSTYTYGSQSSGGAGTPTSINYANTPGSPFGSVLGSPVSVSRPWDDRTPGRRLSVPSGANPFQATHGSIQGPPYLNSLTPSNTSHNSSNSSLVASPTGSAYSFARHDSSGAAEADWRRRTWHPTSYTNYNYQRPATSGLSFYQTPDAPRPAFAPQAVAAAGQTPRLPGFETFDQISQRPTTPPRQAANPSVSETPNRPSIFSGSSERSIPILNDRNRPRSGHTSWDMSLHQNLTKLDIANGTPPKEPGSWGQQVLAEMQDAASASSHAFSHSRPPSHGQMPQHTYALSSESQKRQNETDHYSKPQSLTSQRSKRNGWYIDPISTPRHPVTALRTSPEDSSSSDGVPTPLTASMDYQPSIVHPNGYIEAHSADNMGNNTNLAHPVQHGPNYPQSQEPPRALQHSRKSELSGLEALAAAATSGQKAQSSVHMR